MVDDVYFEQFFNMVCTYKDKTAQKFLASTIGDLKFGNNYNGFILNLFDTCIAKCMIMIMFNKKQTECTILSWHVHRLP